MLRTATMPPACSAHTKLGPRKTWVMQFLFLLWFTLACLSLPGCAPMAPTPVAGADTLNVADAALASGNADMALSVAQSVLAQDPNNLQALYHEGAAYYALNRCEDAIASYTVALGLDPQSSAAETGIGRCLLRRNAIEAEQAFAAAVADDPTNAAALNDLGIARDLRGNFASAEQPYEKALLLAPGTLATEVNLGLSLALADDAADALQYLGPLATGENATPKIREDYATALIAAGRLNAARQILAIDLPPDRLDQALSMLATLISPPTVPSPLASNAAPSAAAASIGLSASGAGAQSCTVTPLPMTAWLNHAQSLFE